ncbi:hypothetical protein [Massilia sp. Dwa41.01b]|uniref:hypothetical protein n=1 Tax=Massilia sp. Dwa41.01b TaxID=2709302 RepID=UPI001E328ED1|nr:hypothetical protein [Massilia sp. Dwa41.01b]
MQHFLAGGLHRGQALGSLAPGLDGLGQQFLGRARGFLGHRRFRFELLGGAAARFLGGAGACFGGDAAVVVGLHARAQVGRFQAHRFEALVRGLGGGAQGFQAGAVRFDGLLGRPGIGQRGGSGLGIHGGAFLGQRAGVRLGMGARLGGDVRLGLGLDPGDRFLDRPLLQRAPGRRSGRNVRSLRLRQVDREVGIVVWCGLAVHGCSRVGWARARAKPLSVKHDNHVTWNCAVFTPHFCSAVSRERALHGPERRLIH